jgi:hypothetical protein
MDLNERFVATSYEPSDVRFLLEPIKLAPLPIDARERAIAGGRHYSEMIGAEDAPSLERIRVFRDSVEANGGLLATALLRLAQSMYESLAKEPDSGGPGSRLVIASIARAGTPVGAILTRWLRERHPELRTEHYSISVIRDRGIDAAALAMMLKSHASSSIRFVDGWTGKGTIAKELRESAARLEIPGLDAGLWVPLDVCGAASQASTARDFLLPHAVLGGTVSGLVSRSVLPAEAVGTTQLHRCVELQDLRRYDLSRWYLGRMLELMRKGESQGRLSQPADWSTEEAEYRRIMTESFIKSVRADFGIVDPNRLKLGLGETVRVLLRRRPSRVMLDSTARAEDRALVRRLAALRGIEPTATQNSPFAATAIIEEARP